MLKKLRIGLMGLLLSSLNASADGVRIEIEMDGSETQIHIEAPSSAFLRVKKNDEKPSFYQDEKPSFYQNDEEPSLYQSDGMEWAGPACSGNPECEALCDAIYSRPGAMKRCQGYPTVFVEKVNEVVETLKRSRQIELENMNLAAFNLLLYIDYKPLEEIMGRISPVKKKTFANWLAFEPTAADIIASAEDDFEILTKLLGVSREEITANLNKLIAGPDNFIEVALEEGNDVALEWVSEFFGKQRDTENSSDYEKHIFKQYYCALSLNADSEEEYFNYEFFEDILDQVLRFHRPENAPEWWTENADALDLNEKWKSEPHDVCKALGVGVEEAKPQTGETG